MTCRAATSATTCAGASPTGAQMGYDNEGRLTSWQNTPSSSPTQSATYLSDGAGQRVQQAATSGGTTTTTSYIGALEEVTSSGSTTTTTAYYGGIAESVNGALSYLLSDGLGSVSEAVATSGSVAATQRYGPYGAVRYQSGTLPTSKGYTGQISDAATSGLDYYNARYYDAVAGQFTSADTTLAGGLNRYAYVAGNPESKTDPSGHYRSPAHLTGDAYSNTGWGKNNGPWTDAHRHDKGYFAIPSVDDHRGANAQERTAMAIIQLTLGHILGNQRKLSSEEINAYTEWIDAQALADYFQLGVIMLPQYQQYGKSPDYMIGLLAPVPGSLPSFRIVNPTYAEQMAPQSAATDLDSATNKAAMTAVQKAFEQAPLMVVDISFSPTLSKLDDAQIQTLAQNLLNPSGTNLPPPARVIVILNGAVRADQSLDPAAPLFGPSPAPPPNVA